jgi:hypothetical protein
MQPAGQRALAGGSLNKKKLQRIDRQPRFLPCIAELEPNRPLDKSRQDCRALSMVLGICMSLSTYLRTQSDEEKVFRQRLSRRWHDLRKQAEPIFFFSLYMSRRYS